MWPNLIRAVPPEGGKGGGKHLIDREDRLEGGGKDAGRKGRNRFKIKWSGGGNASKN
jgi:hypothetical protein